MSKKEYHDKCFRNGSQNDDFIFDGIKLPNSYREKILELLIDNELKKSGLINRISFFLKTSHPLPPPYPQQEKNLYLIQSQNLTLATAH